MFTNFEIMASNSKVYFHSDSVAVRIPGSRSLGAVVAGLFKKEKKQLDQMSYVFCSDKKLRAINRKFLNHDYFTDIITFDLSVGKRGISGESYISIDRVKENASLLGRPFREELYRVVIHGALHLCGYSDKSEKERMKMRKLENKYLSLLS